MKRTNIRGLALALSVTLVLAACGGAETTEDESTDEPVETDTTEDTDDESEGDDADADASAASGGDDVVAAAQAIVDAAKEVPGTDDLGEPIDVSSLQGETVYSIPIDASIPFYQVGEDAMREVAEAAGIDYVTFPSDGSQTSYQQGIQQAINADAGAVLLNGPLPETLAPQIADAVAADIPIVPLHISDPSEGSRENLPYESFAPFYEAARLMALYAIVDLEGEPVHALVIEAAETGPSAGMVEAIETTLAEDGPEGSTATVINSPVPSWSTELQGAVQSELIADPEINAVLPIFDSMALFAAPGIEQSAPDRDIGIYTFNGNPPILELIEEGSIVRMNAAENPEWVAYTNMDTTFRAMLGVDPVPGASGPLRVIDASNVDETGTPPQSGLGFGDEYVPAYLDLWGLS